MNKNKLIFAAIASVVILFAGTFVILEWFGPPRTISFDFPGPADANLVGEVEVDGEIKRIEEKLPAKLAFSARKVKFALLAIENKTPQYLPLSIFVDGQFLLGGGANGVRGEISAPVFFSRLRAQGFFQQSASEKIRE